MRLPRSALLLGLARTHLALGRFLRQSGAEVTVADDRSLEALGDVVAAAEQLGLRLALGGTDPSLLHGIGTLYVSPGVPRSHALVAAARRDGIAVSSEIELFFDLCDRRIAAITGSAGKTTTTTLVGRMLEASGVDTFVGGNIGRPAIDYIAGGFAGEVVLELSSFQLENLRRSPGIGAILNLTPNHLDRHLDLDAYRDAKANLLRYQKSGDVAILNADDETLVPLSSLGEGRRDHFSLQRHVQNGAWFDGDRLLLGTASRGGVICRRADLRLRGDHNIANVLAAATTAAHLGASMEAISAIARTFGGVEHRIEEVGRVGGALWYNDSKATSPAETIAALRSFDPGVILLAGGRSKRVPLDDLAREIQARARSVVLFGELRCELHDAIAQAGAPAPAASVGSLREAVDAAYGLARPGDIVLLSPSGSSFDEFRDYEARGRAFKEMVGTLAATER